MQSVQLAARVNQTTLAQTAGILLLFFSSELQSEKHYQIMKSLLYKFHTSLLSIFRMPF